jgi:periplasmic protein TonB
MEYCFLRVLNIETLKIKKQIMKQYFKKLYLDIVFEGKNKAYGAYELRKNYNKRLTKSMAIIYSTIMLFSVYSLLASNKNTSERKILPPLIKDSLIVTVVNLPKTTKPKDVAKTNSKPSGSAPKTNTKTNNFSIVKDNTKVKPDTTSKVNTTLPNPNPNPFINNNVGTISKIPSTGGNGIGPATNGTGTGLATNTISKNVNKTFKQGELDEEASFPGGEKAFNEFLNNNLNYPEEALAYEEELKVTVTCIVNKDGDFEDIALSNNIPKYFKTEILRVLKLMPKFKPGKVGGEAVKSYTDIPMEFIMVK